MKNIKLSLPYLVFICLMVMQISCVQYSKQGKLTETMPEAETVSEITELSKMKWQWMADKNVAKLEPLFHDKSKFVHMSGSWKKERELEIIESGSIWYKNADVHDVAVEVFGNTAVLWNRITLLAHVRGNDVSNEFTVTEVYQHDGKDWKLLDLTFSSVRDRHEIEQ